MEDREGWRHEGRAYQIDTRRKVRAGEGHEGRGGALCIYGRSIARSGPEAAITHAQSLYGVEYPNQWRGDDGERERERTFVSIHVNYRTRGGERQREEGAPFFFSFPQLPLYF